MFSKEKTIVFSIYLVFIWQKRTQNMAVKRWNYDVVSAYFLGYNEVNINGKWRYVMGNERLWYREPARDWNEALPIGNGRIGGMVFGRPSNETIQVNEDSVWYGGPMDRDNPSTKEKLGEIRELILQGRIHEAERLCKKAMSGTPHCMRIYQTLGNIGLDFDLGNQEITEYERGLNLKEAVTYTRFKADDTWYEREMFMSSPDEVCVMHLTASGKNKMNLDVLMTRNHMYDYSKKYTEDTTILGGNLGKGASDYVMMCKTITPDGQVEVLGDHIYVTDASEIFLLWSAGTTYRMSNLETEVYEILEKAAKKSYEQLRKEHVEDYQKLFNRVKLELVTSDIEAKELPTDERLKRVAEGIQDISLEKMYFDFGRYLLISCSRPGTLPANLQGIWNKDIQAPWDSKYTININTEMNYWPAEICDLGECHLPLFELIKKMYPNGKKTARDMYGCRGFVAHHNTDLWGDTSPQDLWIPGTFWVMGAAWLCTHIWTHYEYTHDVAFLEEMFPIMREAALFFLDFCIDYKGHLCTCPSVSPENTFILPNGEKGANHIGVTMDNQIMRDLFTQCNDAATILGVHDELDEQIREACKKLIPTRIGSDGRIMEWCEEYEEKDKGHRHISHLYGLHPSCQITKDGTPELAKAAELTLQKRLENGGGHTGWSRAWIMNHYAKLWDGEKAHENLRQLLIKSTLPNLFDNHPPFQIDGNFGSIAAMVEMIVQSDAKRIVLLPALPSSWPDGKLEGVKVRGNARMNLTWENGKLIKAQICAGNNGIRRIEYGDKAVEVELKKDVWTEVCFS